MSGEGRGRGWEGNNLSPHTPLSEKGELGDEGGSTQREGLLGTWLWHEWDWSGSGRLERETLKSRKQDMGAHVFERVGREA